MAKITTVETLQVDLKPKVKRTDAVQSFESQETPIVKIRDVDGVEGIGYSYTIGTGGSSVVKLLDDHLVPLLIGREADEIERIWRDLFYRVHATTVGALTSIALAAIDTALWDLRSKRAKLPLHKAAGGAKDRIKLYYTEGGWLHIDEGELVEEAQKAKERGFGGTKIKVGRPHVAEDVRRLRAVRQAVGDDFDVMTDAKTAISPGSRSRSMPMTSWPTSGYASRRRFRLPSASLYIPCRNSRITFRTMPARSSRSMSAASAASPPG